MVLDPDLTAQLDRRFETVRREQAQQIEHVKSLLDERYEYVQSGITLGDDRLREHISNQIMQIRDALASAEKLELARIDALHREHVSDMKAAAEAVSKAERATEKRFEGVNEWRAQSADRQQSQREETATLTATFLPREVAETQFGELRKQLAANTDRINNTTGERRGVAEFRTTLIAAIIAIVGIAAVISPHIH